MYYNYDTYNEYINKYIYIYIYICIQLTVILVCIHTYVYIYIYLYTQLILILIILLLVMIVIHPLCSPNEGLAKKGLTYQYSLKSSVRAMV